MAPVGFGGVWTDLGEMLNGLQARGSSDTSLPDSPRKAPRAPDPVPYSGVSVNVDVTVPALGQRDF